MEELRYKNYKFVIYEGVYYPGEDSFMLLEEILKKEGDLLEIGCGSGLISIIYEREKAKKGKNYYVVGVDKEEKAIKNSIKNAQINNSNSTFIKSDMFKNIDRKFDYVIFNPPYLGRDFIREGREEYLYDKGQIKEFINRVERFAKRGYLIILSSENERYEEYRENLEKRGGKVIRKTRYFFEDLIVIEVNKERKT